MMPMSVFISYSTKDLGYATTVKALLDNLGLRVFLAEYSLRPGQKFDDLQYAIRAADIVLVIWSGNAKDSEWVAQEIGVGLGAGRLVLPVALDAGVPLPGFLRGTKYVNAFTDRMASLPVIQRVILEWTKWIGKQRAKHAAAQQTSEFWKAVGAVLAVVGGVTVLDGLTRK